MIEPPSDCPSSVTAFRASAAMKEDGVAHWIFYPVEKDDYETVGRSYWCHQPNVQEQLNDAYKHHLALLCWGTFHEVASSTKKSDGETLTFEEVLALVGSFAAQYNEYLKVVQPD